MRYAWLAGAALWLFVSSALVAQDTGQPVDDGLGPGSAAPAIVDHETVVVSGALPGPGLWKVRKDGHTLYVLATLSPLPRRMEWESAGVESVVARAQRVLLPPSFTLDADVGVFRSLMLVPSLLKARRNPDGRRLQEVVPAGLYARWAPLKQRYIGRDGGVERWRPIFAAQELYEAAMRRSGLTLDHVVDKEVRRMAKRHDVPLRGVNFKLHVEDPKSAIREFQDTALADTDCFARTLARIETDLEAMRRRANAWATGDTASLLALPVDSQYGACIEAVTGSALARRLGVTDLGPRLETMWLDAAEEALARDAVSLAMLPLAMVTSPKGYLARLKERGYEVEAP
ncbi:TraB/GumN family protein [Luteimonas composti]|uniref:TraB/GumN family protein n=1 Tax=Luteimonas composti TaxID=398257 RepID=A0ABT6MRR2_9GAMM|nr:TraB/GumN family protein [Luteimonas composti]MDH7453129.1 TraB/GumN family protein [Luteimonas composti]